jgi:hypothetical protein
MRRVLSDRALLSAVTAYAAAITPANLIPLQVPGFETVQHLSDSQIGAVALCEALALALTTIFAAALPLSVARLAGILGPLIVTGCQLESAFWPTVLGLCVLRALVGTGCGLAGALVARNIAASSAAAPAFGLANGMSALMTGLLLLAIPWFPSTNPGMRVFVPLAVLGALLALAAYCAPHRMRGDLSPSAGAPARRPSHPLAGAALVAATLLIYIPLGGIWTFSVQLGANLGMSERTIGAVLVFVVFGGLFGGGIAAWICTRMGLRAAALATCSSCVLACGLVGSATGPASFAWAFLFYSAAYQFAITALQVIAALIDCSGRLPAVLLGTTLIGYALGSSLVGYLLQIHHPGWVWWGGAAACALALVPTLYARRALTGSDGGSLTSHSRP